MDVVFLGSLVLIYIGAAMILASKPPTTRRRLMQLALASPWIVRLIANLDIMAEQRQRILGLSVLLFVISGAILFEIFHSYLS